MDEPSSSDYDVHRPHDSLFRAVFSDPATAVGFVRAYLPESVSAELQWSTLALRNNTFIDDELRDSESDLLFAINRQSGRSAWLYVLLEHQSTPSHWLRYRLLKYCCRIWDRDRDQSPKESELRPIVPLVFYQGAQPWKHSTEFSELFAEEVRVWPWLPRFRHLLIDQSNAPVETIAGELKGRIAQLTMLAVYRDHWAMLQRVVPMMPICTGAEGWMGYALSSYTCWPRRERRSVRGSLQSYAGRCADQEVMP